MAGNPLYDVFLSYDSLDHVQVERVANALKSRQRSAFVDRWEESYTSCGNSRRRMQFVQELLEAISRNDSPLSVVLTVQADVYTVTLQARHFSSARQEDPGPDQRTSLQRNLAAGKRRKRNRWVLANPRALLQGSRPSVQGVAI